MTNDEHRTPSGGVSATTAGVLPMQMRGPADMAEMLPYLLGFFPDDSIVAVGLQGPALQQGGVIRLDIPEDPGRWQRVARETAALLLELSEKRDRRPEQVLLYLVRDPVDAAAGATPPDDGPETVRPLADHLATAFREAGVLVKESLCVSGGRWWSFLCTQPGCCDPGGTPIRPAHLPSAIAAAATFAGLAPRGSRRAIVAGLAPVGPPTADLQRQEIERAGPGFIRELAAGRLDAVHRTGLLLAEAMAEFRAGAREVDAERSARLLLGLQDKLGRDRGAEYAEPHELATAQRLWRHLVRRCVDPFEHLAAPPLTLLAWTAWLAGDTATARIMLSQALEVDADYTLAQLLYESINAGLDPERLRDNIREQRADRGREGPPDGGEAGGPDDDPDDGPAPAPSPSAPAPSAHGSATGRPGTSINAGAAEESDSDPEPDVDGPMRTARVAARAVEPGVTAGPEPTPCPEAPGASPVSPASPEYGGPGEQGEPGTPGLPGGAGRRRPPGRAGRPGLGRLRLRSRSRSSRDRTPSMRPGRFGADRTGTV
ncbi:DUF4192 domain-containing protein [Kitasatospora sp. NE20-6]|uniref:DUF4192 domain-containing protein n=1 Tax=Kitasatospora sp. NE20-6 TaxID=2859066 RepID=UPI0038B257AF